MRQRQTEGEAGRERERESRDSRQAGRQADWEAGKAGSQRQACAGSGHKKAGRQAG